MRDDVMFSLLFGCAIIREIEMDKVGVSRSASSIVAFITRIYFILASDTHTPTRDLTPELRNQIHSKAGQVYNSEPHTIDQPSNTDGCSVSFYALVMDTGSGRSRTDSVTLQTNWHQS